MGVPTHQYREYRDLSQNLASEQLEKVQSTAAQRAVSAPIG
jgi:hypothetical protein